MEAAKRLRDVLDALAETKGSLAKRRRERAASLTTARSMLCDRTDLLVAISDASLYGSQFDLTWDEVINALMQALDVECADMDKKKAVSSATAGSSTSAPRHEFVDVLRMAVRMAIRADAFDLKGMNVLRLVEKSLDTPARAQFLASNLWFLAGEVIAHPPVRARLHSSSLLFNRILEHCSNAILRSSKSSHTPAGVDHVFLLLATETTAADIREHIWSLWAVSDNVIGSILPDAAKSSALAVIAQIIHSYPLDIVSCDLFTMAAKATPLALRLWNSNKRSRETVFLYLSGFVRYPWLRHLIRDYVQDRLAKNELFRRDTASIRDLEPQVWTLAAVHLPIQSLCDFIVQKEPPVSDAVKSAYLRTVANAVGYNRRANTLNDATHIRPALGTVLQSLSDSSREVSLELLKAISQVVLVIIDEKSPPASHAKDILLLLQLLIAQLRHVVQTHPDSCTEAFQALSLLLKIKGISNENKKEALKAIDSHRGLSSVITALLFPKRGDREINPLTSSQGSFLLALIHVFGVTSGTQTSLCGLLIKVVETGLGQPSESNAARLSMGVVAQLALGAGFGIAVQDLASTSKSSEWQSLWSASARADSMVLLDVFGAKFWGNNTSEGVTNGWQADAKEAVIFGAGGGWLPAKDLPSGISVARHFLDRSAAKDAMIALEHIFDTALGESDATHGLGSKATSHMRLASCLAEYIGLGISLSLFSWNGAEDSLETKHLLFSTSVLKQALTSLHKLSGLELINCETLEFTKNLGKLCKLGALSDSTIRECAKRILEVVGGLVLHRISGALEKHSKGCPRRKEGLDVEGQNTPPPGERAAKRPRMDSVNATWDDDTPRKTKTLLEEPDDDAVSEFRFCGNEVPEKFAIVFHILAAVLVALPGSSQVIIGKMTRVLKKKSVFRGEDSTTVLQDATCLKVRSNLWTAILSEEYESNGTITVARNCVVIDICDISDRYVRSFENLLQHEAKRRRASRVLRLDHVEDVLCLLLSVWVVVLEKCRCQKTLDSIELFTACEGLLEFIRANIGSQILARTKILYLRVVSFLLKIDISSTTGDSVSGGRRTNSFQLIVKKSLTDDDVRVRLAAAGLASSIVSGSAVGSRRAFFDFVEDEGLPGLEDTKDTSLTDGRLKRPKQGLPYGLSSLVTLGEVCYNVEELRIICLGMIYHRLVKANEVSVTVGQSIMMRIATRLNYSSPTDLFSSYSKYILSDWLSSNRAIEEFPFQVIGYDDEYQFAKNHLEDLLPVVFYREDSRAASWLSESLGLEVEEIIRENASTLWRVWPMKVTAESERGHRVWEKLETLAPALRGKVKPLQVWQTLLPSLYVLDEGEDSLPDAFYTGDAMQSSLQQICGTNKMKLLDNKKGMVDILMDIWYIVDGPSPVPRKSRQGAISFLGIILDILGPEFFDSAVLVRLFFHICVRAASHTESLRVAMRLVECSFQQCLQRNEVPRDLLTNFVLDLMDIAQAEGIAANQRTILVESLGKVLSAAKNESLELIQDCPDLPALRGVRSKFLSIRSDGASGVHSAVKEVLRLHAREIARDSPLPKFVYSSRISQLTKALSQSLSAPSNPPQLPIEDVCNVVQALVHLARHHTGYGGSDSIAGLGIDIGTCLGLLVSQYPASQALLGPESGDTRDTSNGDIKREQLIRDLTSLLTHSSCCVADTASATLRQVLATTAGKSISQHIEGTTKLIVACFKAKQSRLLKAPEYINHRTGCRNPPCLELNSDDLWKLTRTSSDEWITELCWTLAHESHDDILRMCQAICRTDPGFARKTAPLLLEDVLRRDEKAKTRLGALLEKHVFNCESAQDRCVAISLEILQYQRIGKLEGVNIAGRRRSKGSERRSVATESKICGFEIPYLSIAKGAIRANFPVSALMYAEYAMYEDLETVTSAAKQSGVKKGTGALPVNWDFILSREELRSIVFSAIGAIADKDMIHGIPISGEDDGALTVAEHEGKWLDVSGGFDVALSWRTKSNDSLKDELGLLKSVFGMGRFNLFCNQWTALCLQSIDISRGDTATLYQMQDLRYACAWRLGQWDSPQHITGLPAETRTLGFHERLHGCFQAMVNRDADLVLSRVDTARSSLVQEIGHSARESSKNLGQILERMHLLQEVEDEMKTEISQQDMTEKWPRVLESISSHSELSCFTEEYYALRLSIAYARGHHHKIARRCSDLVSAVSVRREGQSSRAFRLLKLARSGETFERSSIVDRCVWKLTLARLHAESGELPRAENVVQDLLVDLGWNVQKDDSPSWSPPTLDSELIPYLRAASCHAAAAWLSCSENMDSRDLFNHYFRMSAQAFGEDDGEGPAKCYFEMAEYADRRYKACKNQVAQEEYQQATQIRRNREEDVKDCEARLRGTQDTAQDLIRHRNNLKKAILERLKFEETINQELMLWPFLAMECYARSLMLSNKYDLRAAFQLVALWTEDVNKDEGSKKIEELFGILPLGKLIPLSYQIASRLSRDSTLFGKTIFRLVQEMTKAYPDHCLWIVIALANGKRLPSKQKNRTNFVTDDGKVMAARAILDEIQKTDVEIVQQATDLADALNDLAESKDQSRKTEVSLGGFAIGRLKNLNRVVIPTVALPFHGVENGNFPTVQSFGEVGEFVGGINQPKLIFCTGSDGRTYKLLVKGNDDMRQDAVVESVFQIVDKLLLNDKTAAARKLSIRTYRVVPLAPTSGVLEWVDNTQPLTEYLLKEPSGEFGGAHGRYRPQDDSFMECRRRMTQAGKDTRKRREAFYENCDRVKPVFRNFFSENFPDPREWLERRNSYTKSTAVNAMIGFFCGLGDRHGGNILIDLKTAEIVSIDLGICFEKGKKLSHPETVPFRFTRDIVDGMGPFGKNGTFRRCSEVTMRVLRDSREVLLIVLEVFLFDPLFEWSISPLKRFQAGDKEPEELGGLEGRAVVPRAGGGTHDAQAALVRVQEKLSGYESHQYLTVESHVRRLMSEAESPENLCQLFEGWGSWI